ncbi:MAG: tetratricopeptide repeat protein [Leptolyngbya sp. SIO1D8]|nr:tetratricopeptide repeat protein [Leptolyngbya sp. SIO1D8]
MSTKILGGRYHILNRLGGGGFGQTFLAQDQHLPGNPCCVVKRLQPRTCDGVSLDSARRLFDAEAEALYALGHHDRIPYLLAHFEEGEQFYLVQEYIEGSLLTEEIHPGNQLSQQKVIDLLQDLLETLCTVHHRKVIHRDIKPSNLIRRNRDGHIVLIDFGSVKQVRSEPVEQQGQVSMTIAIGSLGYMPNEQLAGQPCLSSDIYAVGILALQALTGLDPRRLPKDPRTSELMWRELVDIKPALADVLDVMVRYDFRQRYSSAREALEALNRAVAPPGTVLPSQQLELTSEALEAHVAWLERADELFQENRFEKAARCYEKVLQAQPKATTAWFKLGIALENLEQYDKAIDAYAHVTQQRPEDYLAWLKLGKALEQVERFGESLESYDEVLRLQPENYWVWADRGLLLERLNRVDEALAAFERAVQIKPDFQYAQEQQKRLLIDLKQVEKLYTLHHYDDAIAACDQAIETNPNDATAWFMRGMALEHTNQLADAAIAYNNVVGLQADDHMAWFRLGTVLEELGYHQRAAKAYNNVTRLQPRNHWAWHQQGRVLEQLEDYSAAISAYQKATQIQPRFEPSQEAHQRLIEQTLAPAISQTHLSTESVEILANP